MRKMSEEQKQELYEIGLVLDLLSNAFCGMYCDVANGIGKSKSLPTHFWQLSEKMHKVKDEYDSFLIREFGEEKRLYVVIHDKSKLEIAENYINGIIEKYKK